MNCFDRIAIELQGQLQNTPFSHSGTWALWNQVFSLIASICALAPNPPFHLDFVICMHFVQNIDYILVMPKHKFTPPKSTHNEHLPQITWITQQVFKILIYMYNELMLVFVQNMFT
jgi:hypothetical protein